MEKKSLILKAVYWIATLTLETILVKIFENKLKSIHSMIANNFLELLILLLVTTTIILVCWLFINYLLRSIKELRTELLYTKVRLKYHDIIMIKMQGQNPHSPSWVYDEDVANNFTDAEMKYLVRYLLEVEKRRTYMRGKNIVLGQNI